MGADLADLDDGTALSLEELDSDDPSPLAGDGSGVDGAAEDFELELDDVEDRGPATGSAGDSLGGDLGIDFDPDRDRGDRSEPADELTATDDLDLDLDLDDDALADGAFDFDDEGDTASTKLDLARAYIDMGDQDGARDILNEVVTEGTSDQQERAQAMLEEL
jgi:pilus assembly protein FimV